MRHRDDIDPFEQDQRIATLEAHLQEATNQLQRSTEQLNESSALLSAANASLAAVEAERDALTVKLSALEAIVAKLPVTADGKVCAGGEIAYTLYGAARRVMWIGEWRAAEYEAIDYDPSCPVNECYSTLAAAEAALSALTSPQAKEPQHDPHP